MLPAYLIGLCLVGLIAGFGVDLFGLVVLCACALAVAVIIHIALGGSTGEALLSALAANLAVQVGYVGAVILRAWLVPKAAEENPNFWPAAERR
jgi:MFS family permease